ncbi:MAG: aminodeoxychorismate synthase component I [Bacteroidetes bacterium HGW-Bacteroidetes-8]|jgi:para-aminobenzoate synthetase component 1|nr:MAG: aminodeoxychorismate synthase component I [Bacteroidetes bacterium HGW-Bacteroidetes-8]
MAGNTNLAKNSQVAIISAAEVCEHINRTASKRGPFLFAVDFELESGIFIEDPINSSEILFRIGDICNRSAIRVGQLPEKREKRLKILNPVPIQEYREKFSTVLEGLMRGDTYLINLTCKTEVETSLTLEEIFSESESPFAICLPGRFVCFSPERFVQIENGVISSRPMKGTIMASVPQARERILSDYKESSEHNTITDLIRNDLGMVSERVWVESFRYIDSVKTDRGEILQVSSDIRGELPGSYLDNLGDLIFRLLPAGSVSGAPKKSTLKLIAKSEGEKRGFYTGVFGFFDGSVFDSAVMIRFIERDKDGKMWYRSGGGITVNSNCEDEHSEMMAKIYFPFESRL